MERHPKRRAWIMPFMIGITVIGASFLGKTRAQTTPAQQPATAAPSPSAGATQVTFTQLSQNVLQPSCVSCHSGANAQGGVDLSTYAGVSAVVVAGNPAQSRLYQAVSSGLMPPSGKLPQNEIQQISDWISAGAKND